MQPISNIGIRYLTLERLKFSIVKMKYIDTNIIICIALHILLETQCYHCVLPLTGALYFCNKYLFQNFSFIVELVPVEKRALWKKK